MVDASNIFQALLHLRVYHTTAHYLPYNGKFKIRNYPENFLITHRYLTRLFCSPKLSILYSFNSVDEFCGFYGTFSNFPIKYSRPSNGAFVPLPLNRQVLNQSQIPKGWSCATASSITTGMDTLLCCFLDFTFNCIDSFFFG